MNCVLEPQVQGPTVKLDSRRHCSEIARTGTPRAHLCVHRRDRTSYRDIRGDGPIYVNDRYISIVDKYPRQGLTPGSHEPQNRG